MEIPILPTETVIDSFPLLLFAGISVAIIFMLLHREFSLEYMRFTGKFSLMKVDDSMI